jgi:hypothetical protein
LADRAGSRAINRHAYSAAKTAATVAQMRVIKRSCASAIRGTVPAKTTAIPMIAGSQS